MLLTATYGTNFAPFLATRVLSEIGKLSEKSFPFASKIILTQIYVDDILGGVDDMTTSL